MWTVVASPDWYGDDKCRWCRHRAPEFLYAPKPYKCPVCEGTGIVSRPPHVAGDVKYWADSSSGPYPCRTCQGTGIVWG